MQSLKICPSCKEPNKDGKRRICSSCRTFTWRTKTKKDLVEFKGGKCEICDYNRCIHNLVFHHRDPSEKEFGISCAGKGIDKLKKEVEKCILLCCRCHGEVHAGMITLPTLQFRHDVSMVSERL